MVSRKTNKPYLSMGKEDPEIAENRDAVVAPPRKSVVEPVDHWAFLDEIEAPMWVDLDLEAASGYKDNDDNWFKISHLFHQSSSRQLTSAFSRVGEGNANKTSTPKLPHSVSRSRGKSYRIKDWGQSNCCGIASNKHHPIKNLISKSSRLNSNEKIKPKPSSGNRKGNARSKVNSVCSYPKPSSNFGDSKTGSSPAAIKEVESKSASTITSESGEQQHQNLLDVSSQTISHTSGLLSSLKVVTLRKSCVTRQALRVEIVGGRQLEGRKSSSGKSSVGSSSHPGYDVKNTTLRASLNKDITPDNNRNAMKAPQANCDKVKRSNMSKESTAKTRDLTFKSGCGSKTIAAAKSAHLETAKSKVNKVVHSKAMRLHRVNAQDSVTGATKANDKVGVNMYNRLGNGKENVTSQRSNTGAGGTFQQVQKVTKQKSIVPKGKISGRSEGKSLTNVIQKVHFR
ncbi:hypothetical protein CsSME_00018503 [Camellia sinensis var. sinensis]